MSTGASATNANKDSDELRLNAQSLITASLRRSPYLLSSSGCNAEQQEIGCLQARLQVHRAVTKTSCAPPQLRQGAPGRDRCMASMLVHQRYHNQIGETSASFPMNRDSCLTTVGIPTSKMSMD